MSVDTAIVAGKTGAPSSESRMFHGRRRSPDLLQRQHADSLPRGG